jgi:hypothetical protein
MGHVIGESALFQNPLAIRRREHGKPQENRASHSQYPLHKGVLRI